MTDAGTDRTLAYAARVLGEFRRRCRSNGVHMPPELESLALLLASDRQAPPQLAAAEQTGDLLCMSYDEAARRLSVSRRTIERLTARCTLPTVTVGGCKRIRSADLDAFVEGLAARSDTHSPGEVAAGGKTPLRSVRGARMAVTPDVEPGHGDASNNSTTTTAVMS